MANTRISYIFITHSKEFTDVSKAVFVFVTSCDLKSNHYKPLQVVNSRIQMEKVYLNTNKRDYF